jgi:hypothetical protein
VYCPLIYFTNSMFLNNFCLYNIYVSPTPHRVDCGASIIHFCFHNWTFSFLVLQFLNKINNWYKKLKKLKFIRPTMLEKVTHISCAILQRPTHTLKLNNSICIECHFLTNKVMYTFYLSFLTLSLICWQHRHKQIFHS